MTLAAAQTAAAELRTALLDHGVRAVSLELQPGVGPKADPWGVAPFVRGLGHHIVSRPPGTPGLALVKKGRTGKSPLQGPLCNGYGGYDLVARIITLGWANHPGEGGPWSVPGWGTVPKDNGRGYLFGWEFEGGIVDWTDEMHLFMAQCGAGTLDWLGWLNQLEAAPLECWGEHGNPWAQGRKIDRLNYTAASGRARIAAVRSSRATAMATTPQPVPTYFFSQEDPMQLPANTPVHLSVPPVPDGCRAVLVATGASDTGAVLYSKGITRDGKARPVLTTAGDWKLWLAPGFRPEIDVSDLAAVELVNHGAATNPIALAAATIVILPKK